jgi:hypothetical protein
MARPTLGLEVQLDLNQGGAEWEVPVDPGVRALAGDAGLLVDRQSNTAEVPDRLTQDGDRDRRVARHLAGHRPHSAQGPPGRGRLVVPDASAQYVADLEPVRGLAQRDGRRPLHPTPRRPDRLLLVGPEHHLGGERPRRPQVAAGGPEVRRRKGDAADRRGQAHRLDDLEGPTRPYGGDEPDAWLLAAGARRQVPVRGAGGG